MSHIGIYRTINRHGSVIETELIQELFMTEYPEDLQELAEQYEGDFAVVENEYEDCVNLE